MGFDGEQKLAVGILAPVVDGKIVLNERWKYPFNKRDVDVVLIPTDSTPEELEKILPKIHAVLLPGGNSNIHPTFYTPFQPETDDPSGHEIQRDIFSMDLIDRAYDMKLPVLGICRGMQEIVVAFDGKIAMLEDLGINHAQNFSVDINGNDVLDPEDIGVDVHPIKILPGGKFERIYGCKDMIVNSVHHQGVPPDFNLPDIFIEEARAPDGVREAISIKNRPIVGVQSHFEIVHDEDHDPLFDWFVQEMKTYKSSMTSGTSLDGNDLVIA